jgi:hypothetical protein
LVNARVPDPTRSGLDALLGRCRIPLTTASFGLGLRRRDRDRPVRGERGLGGVGIRPSRDGTVAAARTSNESFFDIVY